MILFLKYLFTILHIITAAAWFGLSLRMAGKARTLLQLDGAGARALADDTQRSVRLMGLFAVLTLVFAFTTFGLGSSLDLYGGRYEFHASLLLIVVLVAVQYALIQPAWKKLHAAVMEGDEAEASRKRVAMGVGIGHLLWLVLLVLMFWSRLVVVF